VQQDSPPEDLKKNQAVYDALRDGEFTKTIRLVPTSDTSGSHLRNGLVSAVAARMENKEEALKEFGNFFPAQLKKGMLIDFTWRKGGSLSGTWFAFLSSFLSHAFLVWASQLQCRWMGKRWAWCIRQH
jgi:hypothetical protein